LSAFLPIWALAAFFGGHDPTATLTPAELYRPLTLDNGLVLPYPLDNLFRGWTECASRRGGHHALDIGGVGPDYGVGTPVRAMARSKVMAFATTESDPVRCGKPLKDATTTVRSRMTLPTSKEIDGYGRVWFFSTNYGGHRSGGFITLEILDGPYKGHTVRYLHIAAVNPHLHVGDEVDAGDEVALLGGTAVMDAGPHVHVVMTSPAGTDLDVGKVFGIGSTYVGCKASEAEAHEVRATYSQAAKKLMARLRAGLAQERQEAPHDCGTTKVQGDFEHGIRKVKVPLPAGVAKLGVPWTLTVSRWDPKQKWSPRITITDPKGRAYFTGTQATPLAKRKLVLLSKGSGKRDGTAVVELSAAVDVPLVVEVTAWPTYTRWLKDAKWELTIERACK